MTTLTALKDEADSADGDCPHEIAADQSPLIDMAGLYRQPDPIQNAHAVLKIADALLAAGFVPLAPHLSLRCRSIGQ